MLLTETRSHPHDGRRISPSRIGDDLPQVTVIRPSELILDDHDFASGLVITLQIKPKAPNRVLRDIQHEIHSKQITKHIDVLQKPRCEVQRLMRPHLAGLHRTQPPQLRSSHGPA